MTRSRDLERNVMADELALCHLVRNVVTAMSVVLFRPFQPGAVVLHSVVTIVAQGFLFRSEEQNMARQQYLTVEAYGHMHN